jgi:tetratricopeptide (TPR) repeat protein
MKGTLARLFFSAFAIASIVMSAYMIDPVLECKASDNIAYLPSTEFMKVASLGYRELAADLYWFKAVQYYGGYRLSQNDIHLFNHLAEMITDLDPNFIGAYKLSAIVITEDLGNFAAARNLMEKGLRHNPDDYWLTLEMGFLYYLEGRDYREAEKYFRVAAALPNNDGNRAARFAAEAAKKGGNIEASITLWKELAESSDNMYIRELAEKYIARLEAEKAKAQHDRGGV